MPMDEDLALSKVSPIFMENYFHLLLDMDVEEDVRRIDTTLPLLVVTTPPALIKQLLVSLFNVILQKIGRDTNRLEAIVVHDQ